MVAGGHAHTDLLDRGVAPDLNDLLHFAPVKTREDAGDARALRLLTPDPTCTCFEDLTDRMSVIAGQEGCGRRR